jgi:DNA repair exonuclease SbcCD ATPase subunit
VSDLDKNAKDVEAFKKSCQECIELIKELKENLPDDLTKFSDSDLQEYKKALEQADKATADLKNAKSINKGLVISNLSTYQKQVEVNKTTYTAVVNAKILSKTVTAATNSSKED